MNVTRDVINDLLPSYFSGDASADTRGLVEEYFRQDPAFARETQRAAEALRAVGVVETGLPDRLVERNALRRAKRLLRLQALLLAVASTLSINAVTIGFGFAVEDGHTRVRWLPLPGQFAVVCGAAFFAAIFWVFYFLVRRRVTTRVLGQTNSHHGG
jgi:hypothetical protein